jgi:hypothetical protein
MLHVPPAHRHFLASSCVVTLRCSTRRGSLRNSRIRLDSSRYIDCEAAPAIERAATSSNMLARNPAPWFDCAWKARFEEDCSAVLKGAMNHPHPALGMRAGATRGRLGATGTWRLSYCSGWRCGPSSISIWIWIYIGISAYLHAYASICHHMQIGISRCQLNQVRFHEYLRGHPILVGGESRYCSLATTGHVRGAMCCAGFYEL